MGPGCAGGLVVAGGVEDQFAEEFAGGGVDDADVQVLDEHQDGVRAWVRPMPMWWSFPWTRRVTLLLPSTRSVRTRSWVSVSRLPGTAFGRAW